MELLTFFSLTDSWWNKIHKLHWMFGCCSVEIRGLSPN